MLGASVMPGGQYPPKAQRQQREKGIVFVFSFLFSFYSLFLEVVWIVP
jgi:hypothetical protein